MESEPTTCHFLCLPTKTRLQFYANTDIGGRIIEVPNIPIIQTSCGVQCFRIYSTNPTDRELVCRLECQDDEKLERLSPAEVPPHKPPRTWSYIPGPIIYSMPSARGNLTSSVEPVKRRRCFSVHGLFCLKRVCRQTRVGT